jgi:hypothetical protein
MAVNANYRNVNSNRDEAQGRRNNNHNKCGGCFKIDPALSSMLSGEKLLVKLEEEGRLPSKEKFRRKEYLFFYLDFFYSFT